MKEEYKSNIQQMKHPETVATATAMEAAVVGTALSKHGIAVDDAVTCTPNNGLSSVTTSLSEGLKR